MTHKVDDTLRDDGRREISQVTGREVDKVVPEHFKTDYPKLVSFLSFLSCSLSWKMLCVMKSSLYIYSSSGFCCKVVISFFSNIISSGYNSSFRYTEWTLNSY